MKEIRKLQEEIQKNTEKSQKNQVERTENSGRNPKTSGGILSDFEGWSPKSVLRQITIWILLQCFTFLGIWTIMTFFSHFDNV